MTTDNIQLVVMNIITDIPLEIHRKSDQFFRVEKGSMVVWMADHKKGPYRRIRAKEGDSVTVPKNTYHRIIRTSEEPLKLYTIYSPPHHPKNRKQRKQ
jgi:mannose-6-phosphate isomerase-like protein (cupin superfamily)